MKDLELQILRLLKAGSEVHRENQALLEAGYAGYEINDMCADVVRQDFAHGRQSSLFPERTWVLKGLTERGAVALSRAGN